MLYMAYFHSGEELCQDIVYLCGCVGTSPRSGSLRLQGKCQDTWNIVTYLQSTECLVPEDRAVYKTVHNLEP